MLAGETAEAAPPPVAQPVLTPPPTRTTLTGEIVEAPPPVSQPAMNFTPAQAAAQQLLDPAMMPTQEQMQGPRAPLGARWERALAMALPLLALAMLIIHFAPSAYWPFVLTCPFAIGVMLGATQAIPPFEEAYADVAAVVIMSFLVGPLYTLFAYLIWCLIRQDFDIAVLSMFGAAVIPGILLGHMYGPGWAKMALVGFVNALGFFSMSSCCTGWILSSFLRPVGD